MPTRSSDLAEVEAKRPRINARTFYRALMLARSRGAESTERAFGSPSPFGLILEKAAVSSGKRQRSRLNIRRIRPNERTGVMGGTVHEPEIYCTGRGDERLWEATRCASKAGDEYCAVLEEIWASLTDRQRTALAVAESHSLQETAKRLRLRGGANSVSHLLSDAWCAIERHARFKKLVENVDF